MFPQQMNQAFVPQAQFGMQQQQQFAGMQFSAQQLEQPLMQWGPQNPPCIPQVQVEPAVQQFLPMVAGLVAAEITGRAQTNPLRLYMFNQCASNQWQNQWFQNAVSLVMNYMSLMLIFERVTADPGQAASQAVAEVCELLAVFNAFATPALGQNFVTAQEAAQYQGHMARLDMLNQKIQAMDRQRQSGMSMNQGFQTQQQFGQNPFVQQRQIQPFYTGGQQPQQFQGGRTFSSGSTLGQGAPQGLFQHGPGNQQQQTGHDSAFAGKARPRRFSNVDTQDAPQVTQQTKEQQAFNAAPMRSAIGEEWSTGDTAPMPFASARFGQSNPNQRPEFQPTPAAPVAQAQQVETKVETSGDLTVVKKVQYDGTQAWIPSESQPYLPAFSPSKEKMFFYYMNNGTIVAKIEDLTEQEKMDYDLHKAFHIATKPHPTVKFNRAESETNNARVISANKNVVEFDIEKVKEEPLPEVVAVVRHGVDMVESADYAWATHDVFAQTVRGNKEGDTPADTIHSFAMIVTPFAGITAEESEWLMELSLMRSYEDIRKSMDEKSGKVSRRCWNEVNRRMSKILNDQLKNGLTIGGLSTDNFYEDVNDIIALVTKRYGNVIRQALINGQANSLARGFQLVGGQEALEYFQSLSDTVDGAEDVEQEFAYVQTLCSLTSTTLNSEELDISATDKCGVIVLPRRNANVYAMISSLFEQDTTRKLTFSKHLLRTADGVLYEINYGDIGEDIFILTRVAQ